MLQHLIHSLTIMILGCQNYGISDVITITVIENYPSIR